MRLTQGHNAVTLLRFEPAAPRSRVKHSTTEPLRSLSKTVYQKLQDQYRQSWSASLYESQKCLNYRIIKTEHFENHLIRMPTETRKSFIDYRLCDNKLPIKTGRWANIDNSGTVGDEFHYVLECCFFDFDRKIFLPHIKGKPVNCFTYTNVFNDTNFRRLRRLCNFLEIVI